MPGIDPTIPHRAFWVAVPNYHTLTEVLVVGAPLLLVAIGLIWLLRRVK